MGNNFAKLQFGVGGKQVSHTEVFSFLWRASVASVLTYYSMKFLIDQLDPTSKTKRKAKKRAEAQLKRLNTQSEFKINWHNFNEYEMMIASQLVVPEDIPVGWKDIAGHDSVVQEIRELVVLPLCHREFCNQSKLWQSPKGVLLHGPPGCGKTLIAKAVAKEAGMHFINLDVAMLTDKWYGESQKLASAVFSLALKIQPCIIFIDEIDSFLRSRMKKDHETTAMMKAQFMKLWDGLYTNSNSTVIVMGATNRPMDLDQAILRRMPMQFHIGLPTALQRISILKLILECENVSKDVNYQQLAHLTAGFSGSDLHELCRHASMHCIRNVLRTNEATLSASSDAVGEPSTHSALQAQICISMEDLMESLNRIKASNVHLYLD